MNDWLNSHPLVGIIIVLFLSGYFFWDAIKSFRSGREARQNIEKMKREADRKIKSGDF